MRTAESVVLTDWPPGAGGAEDVDADVALGGDVDLGRLLHERDDLDRGEGRLALVGRAERADPGEAMGAGLDRERAERVRRVDLERRGLDARALGVGRVHDLHGILVALGPAQVHAQQHLGEVGGVVSARTRADRDDRGALVVLAVEQGLHLELVDGLGERRELGARSAAESSSSISLASSMSTSRSSRRCSTSVTRLSSAWR